jgi:pyochelin biosynthetic protein PchC
VRPSERWLRCYRRRPDSRARLVCFPFACGSASFYRPWAEQLPAGVELVAVQYPGHEDRFGEPCLEDLHRLADEVAEVLAGVAGAPLVLFGHSLGAAVAYEVAHRLTGHPTAELAALLVSGRPAPHVAGAAADFSGDDALWAELARLGGTSPVVLDDPRMRRVFTPMLRGDFRMNAGYRPTGGLLGCDIVAYRGESDDTASREEMTRWRDLTSGGFALREFPGGHFYLAPGQHRLLGDLRERLAPVVQSRRGRP